MKRSLLQSVLPEANEAARAVATFVIAKALWYLSDLASNPRDFRLWLVRDLANCPLYIAVATLRIWAIPFSRHGV